MNAEQLARFAETLADIAGGGGDAEAIANHVARTGDCRVWLEPSQRRPSASAVTVSLPKNAPARWLCAAANGGRPFDAEACEPLLRVAAATIGLSARGNERGGRDGFWSRLVAGEYADLQAAAQAAGAHGMTLAPAYLSVALATDAADGSEPNALRHLVRDVFGTGTQLTLLQRGETLLAFVPVQREVDAANARTAAQLVPKRAEKGRAGWKISGGIGTVEAPHQLAAGVSAAQAAMAVGRRAFGRGRVASYEGLGAYRLLYEGADLRRMQQFAAEVLQPLRARDRKEQTELERTLRVFFESGQNVKLAAAALGVHRHTVMYRLRQIGEIGGYSLESAQDQLTLRMAVAIDALHSS